MKSYEIPEIELIAMEAEDIIQASNGGNDNPPPRDPDELPIM